jgi:hypothetical protein
MASIEKEIEDYIRISNAIHKFDLLIAEFIGGMKVLIYQME